jgi:nucleotide-binding universal stress UspA family protein
MDVATARRRCPMFETIVWATDGSEVASEALPAVTDLALKHGSSIVAVHVNQRFRGGRFGGGPLFADEDDLLAKIADQVSDLREAGFVARLEVETTDRLNIAELLATAAQELDADLIVVGVHKHRPATGGVLGSVAKALVNAAHCPVLVVPVVPEIVPLIERQPALVG